MVNDDALVCECIENFTLNESFSAKKDRLYYFYRHSDKLYALYGINNKNVYGIVSNLFEKHFKIVTLE